MNVNSEDLTAPVQPSKAPAVSVVMAVYNMEKYLNDALKCLASQTFSDIEIICVDDGSKDTSAELIREAAKSDPRIIYIYQDNAGAGAARNHGLELARGEYILFLDPDDMFHPDLIRKLYESAVKNNADAAVADASAFSDKGGERKTWLYYKSSFATGCYTREQIMGRLYKIPGSVAWNKLFRRELIMETGLRFQEIPHTNDLFFVRSMLLNCRRISFVNEPLVYYRIGYGESLQDSKVLKWRYSYSAWEKMYDYAAASGILNEDGIKSLRGFLFINYVFVAESFYNHPDILQEFLSYGKNNCWEKWGLDKLDPSVLKNQLIRLKYRAFNKGSVKRLSRALSLRKKDRTSSGISVSNIPYYTALIIAAL